MSFTQSLEVGKRAESQAEEYFQKRNWNYLDVRNNRQYQLEDVDYIVEDFGKVETKVNYHKAIKGRQGNFIWLELLVGNSPGWWHTTRADYFMFFSENRSGIIIKNDTHFQNIVNDLIENGDHSSEGNNRIDVIRDMRYFGCVNVVLMRLYIEDLEETKVSFSRLTTRSEA